LPSVFIPTILEVQSAPDAEHEANGFYQLPCKFPVTAICGAAEVKIVIAEVELNRKLQLIFFERPESPPDKT